MRSSIVSVIMADWEPWRGDGRLCQIGTSRENTRQTQGGITILTVAHIKVTFMQIAVFTCSPSTAAHNPYPPVEKTSRLPYCTASRDTRTNVLKSTSFFFF